jgi:hypothetical protein
MPATSNMSSCSLVRLVTLDNHRLSPCRGAPVTHSTQKCSRAPVHTCTNVSSGVVAFGIERSSSSLEGADFQGMAASRVPSHARRPRRGLARLRPSGNDPSRKSPHVPADAGLGAKGSALALSANIRRLRRRRRLLAAERGGDRVSFDGAPRPGRDFALCRQVPGSGHP